MRVLENFYFNEPKIITKFHELPMESQIEVVSKFKQQLICYYENHCDTLSQEEVLKLLFEFQIENNINFINQNDYESLKFELIKFYCRNYNESKLKKSYVC